MLVRQRLGLLGKTVCLPLKDRRPVDLHFQARSLQPQWLRGPEVEKSFQCRGGVMRPLIGSLARIDLVRRPVVALGHFGNCGSGLVDTLGQFFFEEPSLVLVPLGPESLWARDADERVTDNNVAIEVCKRESGNEGSQPK